MAPEEHTHSREASAETSEEPGAAGSPSPDGREEPTPLSAPALRFWRAAIVLLVAATVLALIQLGSHGRAASAARAVRDGVAWAAQGVGDGVSGAAGAVGDAWDDWSSRLQSIAADEPAPALLATAAPGSSSLLVVATDDSGAASSVALFSSSPDDEHSVILFPPGTLTTIPGYGDFPLGETSRFEDAELTALTISNLLGIRIDGILTLSPGRLAEALGDSIIVDLPAALVVSDGEGSVVLADAGQSALSAALAEAVLVTKGDGDELEWVERQGAVWEAVLDHLVASPATVDRLAAMAVPSAVAGDLLASMATAESRTVGAVPLTRVAAGDAERFTVRGDDAVEFVSARLAHLLIREGERPRIEVLNGNGRIQTTRLVAETLVQKGFLVVKTDNADSFNYPQTRVIAQGRANRAVGAEVADLLDVGQLELEIRAASGVVDISIIVGQDIPTGEG